MVMDKHILAQYSDALARVQLLREQVIKKQRHLERLSQRGYIVTDSVTCGRRGKKPLGTVKISGYPVPEHDRIVIELGKQKENLEEEEQHLREMVTDVEAFIAGIADVEIRNLLTLYYVEELNWVQVAHKMNWLYKRKKKPYTESSCRQKHDRFLQKF
jgi:hypothetical protein